MTDSPVSDQTNIAGWDSNRELRGVERTWRTKSKHEGCSKKAEASVEEMRFMIDTELSSSSLVRIGNESFAIIFAVTTCSRLHEIGGIKSDVSILN